MLQLFKPFPRTPRNQGSFYCLHSYIFSRRSYPWNHVVCSHYDSSQNQLQQIEDGSSDQECQIGFSTMRPQMLQCPRAGGERMEGIMKAYTQTKQTGGVPTWYLKIGLYYFNDQTNQYICFLQVFLDKSPHLQRHLLYFLRHLYLKMGKQTPYDHHFYFSPLSSRSAVSDS